MKGRLNQESYEQMDGIIDIAGVYRPWFGCPRIVSFLECGCEYDGVKVEDEAEAGRVMEEYCSKDGTDLYILADDVRIDWKQFGASYEYRKGKPLFVITVGRYELPEVPDEWSAKMNSLLR